MITNIVVITMVYLIINDGHFLPTKNSFLLLIVGIILLRLLTFFSKKNSLFVLNPDQNCYTGYGTIDELVKQHKIHYTIYEVITKDNYILRMFRLKSKNLFFKPTKGVALFIHGLMDSSDSWLIQEDPRSIPLRLMKEGYDVWLGNTRGNKYSNKHLFKNKDEPSFYNFGIDEMAMFDLPALINFALRESDTKDLILICHSQSTSVYAAAMTDYKTSSIIKRKIRKAILLNPSLNLSGIQQYYVNWLGFLAERIVQPSTWMIYPIVEKFLVPIYFFPASCEWKYKATQDIYDWSIYKFSYIIEKILYIFVDFTPDAEDGEVLYKFLKNFPAGTSWKNLQQLTQQMRDFKHAMKRFDYGPLRNLQIYGKKDPEYYDFTLIKDKKISAYVGKKDFLIPLEPAIQGFANMINNQENIKITGLENWGHQTFFAGRKEIIKPVQEIIIDDIENF